ncbi:hypothetical protein HK100_000745 [Physocladia obscura]|uniref:NADH dehydrogenase [ubiquinone] 1 alpha subcomplex subunit n=1 Tax=Physocladia obscura TaxID=109957 RepID=A0AAD5XFE0_9FUNG|nr:hypothetical protein HK100_000745 [Physocladia obscura]
MRPWRREKLVGSDPKGLFLFFEAPPIHDGSLSKTRRTLEYIKGNQKEYFTEDVPVQWMAWLRHTRDYPPSHEEIAIAEAQKERTLRLAKEIEKKDAEMRIREAESTAALLAESAAKQIRVNAPPRDSTIDGPEAWIPIPAERKLK